MANRFIEKLRGFAELSDRDVGALEAATRRPQAYGPRVDLIREGDQPGPVLVVLEGWALRYKVLPNGSRQIMAFLMPGDACDLNIGMLAEMDHSIQTVTAAKVAKIDGQAMAELMTAHPAIARAMYVAQLVDEGTLRAWIVSQAAPPSAAIAAVSSIVSVRSQPSRSFAETGTSGGTASRTARTTSRTRQGFLRSEAPPS